MTSISMAADIPSAHPRMVQFRRLAQRLSAGGLRCDLLLDGERFAGTRSMAALARGEVDAVWVNASHLETVAAPLSVLHEPFGHADAQWRVPGRAQALVSWVDGYTAPAGVRTLAVMRGADQLFASARSTIADIAQFQGQRVRVAGAGMYESLMRALGAEPVVMPIPDIPGAFTDAKLDQVFTSPGGWQTQLGNQARFATWVPGLMFITYFLLCRSDRLAALPAAARDTMMRTAQREVTEAWREMQDDDARTLEQAVARGAEVRTVDDAAPWRERTVALCQQVRSRHPEAHAQLKAIAHGS
ncbi:TRAP transporter substrate-binding protein DctP [Hydrogenophaga sp.]|uniref:TRAP transporter substrate-binding protein DctP n=1 Tax=Hydrogenophaga sp. TaxID=1904254 RepID=UPI0027240877|nr:TRAP transporter substrate-binding protein DctP [Hydrogenophaga sp.]MDO9435255.1 TRAP transporter substrate-binding protein DctP [Hydrogenophaga sp.]